MYSSLFIHGSNSKIRDRDFLKMIPLKNSKKMIQVLTDESFVRYTFYYNKETVFHNTMLLSSTSFWQASLNSA